MLSKEMATSNTFSPGLNDQLMESTLPTNEVPVSDNALKPSSSGEDYQKLPYVCSTCSKPFMRKDNLKQHIMIHTGEKPFACNTCQKVFSQNGSLKRHKLTHLKVPRQYKCDQCSDVFLQKFDLLKHRKIHAKPSIKYNCEQCSEVFSRKFDLLKHKKIHAKPTIKHNCEQCSEVFSRKFDLLKHRKTHSKPPITHNCDQCSEVFFRKSDLFKHRKIHKPLKQHKCMQCDAVFNHKSDLLQHVSSLHKFSTKSADPSLKDMLYEKVKHFKRQNALNVFTKTMIDSNEDNNKDFQIFFNSVRSDVLNELNYQMEVKRRMKWYATTQVVVSRITQEGDFETATPYFHSKTILELTNNNLSQHTDDAFAKMINSFEKFTQRGSGWTLEKILNIELSTALYSMT